MAGGVRGGGGDPTAYSIQPEDIGLSVRKADLRAAGFGF